LYQLLANEFGYDHWKISTGYAVAQLAIGAVILLAYASYGVPAVLIFLTLSFIGFTLLTTHIRKIANEKVLKGSPS
jgi:hypothetical protein